MSVYGEKYIFLLQREMCELNGLVNLTVLLRSRRCLESQFAVSSAALYTSELVQRTRATVSAVLNTERNSPPTPGNSFTVGVHASGSVQQQRLRNRTGFRKNRRPTRHMVPRRLHGDPSVVRLFPRARRRPLEFVSWGAEDELQTHRAKNPIPRHALPYPGGFTASTRTLFNHRHSWEFAEAIQESVGGFAQG